MEFAKKNNKTLLNLSSISLGFIV